jgi:hypothetical protein
VFFVVTCYGWLEESAQRKDVYDTKSPGYKPWRRTEVNVNFPGWVHAAHSRNLKALNHCCLPPLPHVFVSDLPHEAEHGGGGVDADPDSIHTSVRTGNWGLESVSVWTGASRKGRQFSHPPSHHDFFFSVLFFFKKAQMAR